MYFQRNTTFEMSIVYVSSTAHNDCYLGRLAKSLQQLKRLNSCGRSLPGQQPVVCLRGGERGTCLGPPLFGGPPLRCYAR